MKMSKAGIHNLEEIRMAALNSLANNRKRSEGNNNNSANSNDANLNGTERHINDHGGGKPAEDTEVVASSTTAVPSESHQAAIEGTVGIDDDDDVQIPEADSTNMQRRPSISKDKELKEAILDLRRLGLKFGDILSQGNVDSSFLSALYNAMDFPFSLSNDTDNNTGNNERHSVISGSGESYGATSEKLFGTSSMENNNKTKSNHPLHVHRAKSDHDSSHLSSQKQQPSFYFETKLSQESAKPTSNNRSIRFGSDRWSQKLNVEVSDDDDDDDDDDIYGQDSEKASINSISGYRQPHGRNSDNSAISESVSRTGTPQEEKQRLQKQINDLLQKMEAKKALESMNSKGENNDNSDIVTDNDIRGPQSVDSGESRNSTQVSNSGSVTPIGAITVGASNAMQELRSKWQRAIERRESVRRKVSDYEGELRQLDVGYIENEIDQLKKLLEEKMKSVVDATFKSATVRAQYQAAEQEETAVNNEVDNLERQLTELESRQKQQEQEQQHIATSTNVEQNSNNVRVTTTEKEQNTTDVVDQAPEKPLESNKEEEKYEGMEISDDEDDEINEIYVHENENYLDYEDNESHLDDKDNEMHENRGESLKKVPEPINVPKYEARHNRRSEEEEVDVKPQLVPSSRPMRNPVEVIDLLSSDSETEDVRAQVEKTTTNASPDQADIRYQEAKHYENNGELFQGDLGEKRIEEEPLESKDSDEEESLFVEDKNENPKPEILIQPENSLKRKFIDMELVSLHRMAT